VQDRNSKGSRARTGVARSHRRSHVPHCGNVARKISRFLRRSSPFKGTAQPAMTLRILRFVIRVLIRLIARVEIHGRENAPPTGGMILAANHIGFLDIVLVYFVIDRTDLFIPVAEKWEKIWWIRAL